MRQIVLVAIGCMGLVLFVAQLHGDTGRRKVLSYDLYSWQEPDGMWNFCVLPDTSREKTVEEVFAKKHRLKGVADFKRQISELPEGSTIVALDRLPTGTGPKAKGSEHLTYPPREIVREIQQHAESRKIKIDVYSEDAPR